MHSTPPIPESYAVNRYKAQAKFDMLLGRFYQTPWYAGSLFCVKCRFESGRGRGRAPAALISAAAFSRASFLLPTATILAPSAASSSAAAKPMPEDAPVTTTTLPSKRAVCTRLQQVRRSRFKYTACLLKIVVSSLAAHCFTRVLQVPGHDRRAVRWLLEAYCGDSVTSKSNLIAELDKAKV
jgi:hypothetical protein